MGNIISAAIIYRRMMNEMTNMMAEEVMRNKENQRREKERAQKAKEEVEKEMARREMARREREKQGKEEERAQTAKEEMERIREEQRKLGRDYQEVLERLRVQEEKQKMSELARKIEDDAKSRVEREIYLRVQAEDNSKKGITFKYPTGVEIQAVRKQRNYQEGNLHCAITGVSGSGKSSLINAFLGYKNKDPNAASTGITETTEQITRYPDPHREWICWYDVPGAGTSKISAWQYFTNQGLYIFDIIIIVIDIRFTEVDVELLLNCKHFGIPTFVVRSKANQHIRNIMGDDGDSDDEGDKHERYEQARDKFITGTRQEFKDILSRAGLPRQKIYIVSNDALRRLVSQNPFVKTIDEVELVEDILEAASKRHKQSQPTAAD